SRRVNPKAGEPGGVSRGFLANFAKPTRTCEGLRKRWWNLEGASMVFGANGLGAIGPAMGFGTMILVLAGIALIGVLIGIWMLWRAAPGKRRKGTLVITLSCVLPLATCCLGPDLLFFAAHGRFPLRGKIYGVIEEGMTKEEVIARFGKPHT